MSPQQRIHLPVTGMTCAACVNRVEKVLNRLPGVRAQVSLATETARIELSTPETTMDQVRAAIQGAGYGIGDARQDPAEADRQEFRRFLLAAALTAPFAVQMITMLTGLGHHWLPGWLQCLLATPVQFWIGARFYRGAYHAIRSGSANMDVLIALGTSAAYVYSVAALLFNVAGGNVYFEASASIITLVLLGKILESRARRRTNEALRDLARMLPKDAHVLRDGKLMDVPADQVQENTLVVILPDERSPVDGDVQTGESEMDESLITGESQPAAKSSGSPIYAGARNLQGQLTCRATRTGARTHLAEVAHLVEDAQASKAPVQQWADRISGVFVPAIVAISIATGLIWWRVSGWDTALLNAIAVLVIACPCALGLATPTAVVAAMGRGAQFAILMRTSAVLEDTARVRHLVVDKTGTLTLGEPRVVAVVPQPGYDAQTVLRIAAAMEQTSSHPIARALRGAALDDGLELTLPDKVTSDAGRGLRATVENEEYRLGSLRHLQEAGLEVDANLAQQPPLRDCTIVGLATKERVLGYIGLSDPVRPTSRAAVDRLHALEIDVVMLTGDREGVARRVAETVGIANFKAQMLPADKAAEVARLQADGATVAMAGDGVNDAPALAQADVGFAMGVGADLAVQTAGVTLMRNDLLAIVSTIELARATVRIIRQNLFFALIYNVIGIPLAATGMLNPVIAGAAMALSSVTVVANSLRLRRWQPTDISIDTNAQARST